VGIPSPTEIKYLDVDIPVQVRDEDDEEKAENYRVRLGRWFESDSLFHSAAAVWIKLLFEFAVVSLPLLIPILAIGILFEEIMLTIRPVGNSAIVIWIGLSLTVLGIVWCFSLAGINIDPEEVTQETEQINLDEATEDAREQ
jgi:hypothetical protein